VEREADPPEAVQRSHQYWSYRDQTPSVRPHGPLAEDFYAVFGLGEMKNYINTVDLEVWPWRPFRIVSTGKEQADQMMAQQGRIVSLEIEKATQQEHLAALEARLAR